ncbi:two-component system response regulator RssB [Klebsiella sp. BIGb0407]|uniref:two-component system response regulator RssB n=1 Tax=Klebsiella sp. BIGb0407 TaxID=2940603 RepID=UPI00216705A3|nr:two-component system response regulator RssB [Klebsiella sp. BIGb0407]MCS3430209.1 two-component system response regulator [Klebsiella sp. BIGb0407]
MRRPLEGKEILIADGDTAFGLVLENYFSSLGAIPRVASEGVSALALFHEQKPDLLICDLAMPKMSGLELIEQIRLLDTELPILVISSASNMSEIAKSLRLGVQDVLLRPLSDFDRLREAVFSCLYPIMFGSRLDEQERLFEDWDALARDPIAASKLLKELQPPVQQIVAQCRINYRQLLSIDKPGLVLDIAPLSEVDLAFYCLDVTRSGDNGVLAALLLRVLFNRVLQDQLVQRHQRLPELGRLLKQLNMLLRQANLTGQFPLLIGYYHREQRNLILISAGLNATLSIDNQHSELTSGLPLGTLNNAYPNQMSQQCDSWHCQIWGSGGHLRLMLSTE